MQVFINDLSLDGQFATPSAFRQAMEPVLVLRMKEPYLRRHLYCSRVLGERYVTENNTLKQAVYALTDRNFKGLVLAWITKNGPFWDDSRQAHSDDYFEYEGEDVTDQGLGEAARRWLSDFDVGTYSFAGSRHNFEKTPISVQHGLSEAPIGHIDIHNFWEIARLQRLVADIRPEPQNWMETVQRADHDFEGIIFSPQITPRLDIHPFSQALARRIFERLRVLNDLVAETRDDGGLTDKGRQLRESHFVGDKAWFTDESDGNKQKFKESLTFPDPESPSDSIFCPFHGKVKSPQFRIHFEWPRPSGRKKIKVVYIGPKITKH